MNENNEEPPKLVDSKCNTCKFGLCVSDVELQCFFHPVAAEQNAFEDEQSNEPGMSRIDFPIEKVRSLCFWRPSYIGNVPVVPISLGCIKECSRYEQN